MIPEAVSAYLDAHKDEQLAQLMELLKFPTVSSQSDHDADGVACAEHIAGHLRGLGFEAELKPWRRHPVVIATSGPEISPDDGPTVLVYGHYDVQPAEPLELWESPPFDPVVRDGALWARGSSDDKGQLFAHVKAVEAYVRTVGRLPAKVIFLAEGEEEIGSPDLEQFMVEHAAELAADYAVVSDVDFFAEGLPTILNGFRGLVYLDLTVTGPSGDLHSGVHGGAVRNPINALAAIVAAMHDEAGRVTIPGFYDDVIELPQAERAAWELLPFDEASYAEELGTIPAGGEDGFSALERRWARPTLDCNGVIGGYTGEGAKTVLPSTAMVKISMRLVANQDPRKVIAGFDEFLAAHTPEGVKASYEVSSTSRPVLVPIDSPAVAAGRAALTEAFGAETTTVRNGASVPITELIQRILGIEPVLMGFGLPSDNLHAPNEHFRLEQFYGGIRASAAVLANLGQMGRK